MSHPGDFSDEYTQLMDDVLNPTVDLDVLLTRRSLSRPQEQVNNLREDDLYEHDAFVVAMCGDVPAKTPRKHAHTAENKERDVEESQRSHTALDPLHNTDVSDGPFDDPTKERSAYGDQLRGRPASNISMVELATWFPSSFVVPTAILRAVRNGFTRGDLAEMQLRPVNRLDEDEVVTAINRIQQQISKAGKLEDPSKSGRWNTAAYVRRTGRQHDMSTNGWKQKREYDGKDAQWTDMKLAEIAHSVPRQNWPTGDDRLLITACIEYAVANPGLELSTLEWSEIIQSQFGNFVLPAAPTTANTNRDTAAHGRLFP
ncbi:hypothetical protein LTR91_002415 [Friedmanniomyces endolithicus]|uniref:Uncharacterized protein n=1 Tax=Friedmanniomyces endolithicus TaxID=329885 RepID=A0AAN6KYV1_9PEZI|nr:hypothetical protein LTR57_010617 [Friedmanniomyces endolithicus]KAK1008496.1 hypothetical protein LTS01_002254 [Friedmanniomyces endolithicus]KAK1010580.1 hypothetical protein LTR91_002415 [Friedmanniomyces endolithicus]KAK1037223.1 hypothetical protein LTS16_013076 [Friedmanniomyces endolithicus]